MADEKKAVPAAEEKAPEASKPAADKPEASKPEAKKSEAKKPAAKKSAAKKPAAKKETKAAPAKKPAAKPAAKTAAKADEIFIEGNGGKYVGADIIELCKNAYRGGTKKQVKSISVYVKSENGGMRAYYVVNEKPEGFIDL